MIPTDVKYTCYARYVVGRTAGEIRCRGCPREAIRHDEYTIEDGALFQFCYAHPPEKTEAAPV